MTKIFVLTFLVLAIAEGAQARAQDYDDDRPEYRYDRNGDQVPECPGFRKYGYCQEDDE
jgi:hypothetical protein